MVTGRANFLETALDLRERDLLGFGRSKASRLPIIAYPPLHRSTMLLIGNEGSFKTLYLLSRQTSGVLYALSGKCYTCVPPNWTSSGRGERASAKRRDREIAA